MLYPSMIKKCGSFYFLFFVLLLLGGACSNPRLLPTNESIPSATTGATVIAPATDTSSDINYPYQETCAQALSAPPADFQPSGILFLEDRSTYKPYLYSLDPGENSPLSQKQDEILLGFAVSPSKEWVAYALGLSNSNQWQLIVSNTLSVQKYEIEAQDPWRNIVDWLDNDRLLIGVKGPNEFSRDTLMLFNPFTGQQQHLRNDFPDIFDLLPFAQWGKYSYSETVFDPTLRFVVFPRLSEDGSQIALWDIDRDVEITHLNHSLAASEAPLWSPDGNQFVADVPLQQPLISPDEFVKDEELFLVNTVGEETRVTYLNDYFSEVNVGYYQWSPDSQKIAFFLTARTDVSGNPAPIDVDYRYERLIIVDLLSHTVTNLCITGTLGFSPRPVWSPDGNYLAIASELQDKSVKLVIVDVNKYVVFPLIDDLVPLGWAVSSE